ncbi:hypothetical protein GWK47_043627 [Chionoecetes opilio]|uniref:Uncharacterized protein n=1 Tax=Chionoecetes opilio TaxID=41210 RepID=A0A8J4YGS0_CHIOP|nr:hypothetical protein GWK47_043627 [Chionoecetes opilio]
MKISKPSTTSSTRGSISFRRGRRHRSVRWIEGSSRRKSERTTASCATCPSSISPETSVSRSRSRGAFHHARWMAKAIYVLKIRMFRSHVQMTTREGKGLEEIALFVVLLYSRAWMEAGLATEAAYNDLNLVKDLHHFQEINGAIGKTTLTTFSRHLWYLGADLVGLSLFSERISMEEKKKIAEETTRKEKDLDRIRFNKAADQLINSSLPSSACVRALTLLNIDISFLSLPVDEWEANPAYQKGVSTVKNLSVTNDGAERGVAMISSYNDSLTKDEKTKQDLLQVVEAHRRNYPHPH